MYRHLAKWRNTRLRCDCGGYWFPHRKTGGACHLGPRSTYYLAKRGGATEAEAQAELTINQLERMFPLPPRKEERDEQNDPIS
jgi:hypothetical protein